jgi:hypothetical protein
MSFDKQRAIRILGEQAETYEEMLRDHPGTASTLSELLETHAELTANRDTVVALKEHVETEYDCS